MKTLRIKRKKKSLTRTLCPQAVLTLVENFERHIDAYKSGPYNETQLRREFIDPLFEPWAGT